MTEQEFTLIPVTRRPQKLYDIFRKAVDLPISPMKLTLMGELTTGFYWWHKEIKEELQLNKQAEELGSLDRKDSQT